MRYYVGNIFYGDDVWHYGVKGQKRGVRRYQNPDGSLKPEGYAHYGRNPHPRKRTFAGALSKLKKKIKTNRDNKVEDASKLSRRRLSRVSDEEVRRRINRLKLENEYLDAKKRHKELTAKKKKQMSEGKKHVLSILGNFANTVVKAHIDANAKLDMQAAKFRDDKEKRQEQREAAREERERQRQDEQAQHENELQEMRERGRAARRQNRRT